MFENELAAGDAAFAAADAVGGVHPIGRETGQIVKAIIQEAKTKTGQRYLDLSMHIKSPKGMAFVNLRLTNFASENQQGWTKGQLLNIGYQGTLSALPSFLPSLIGQFVEIQVSHDEGEDTTFVNVNMRKLVANDGGYNAAPAAFGAPVAAPAQAFADPVQVAPPMAAPVAQQAFAAPPASPSQAVAQAAPVSAFDAPAQVQQAAPAAPTHLPFG